MAGFSRVGGILHDGRQCDIGCRPCVFGCRGKIRAKALLQRPQQGGSDRVVMRVGDAVFKVANPQILHGR